MAYGGLTAFGHLLLALVGGLLVGCSAMRSPVNITADSPEAEVFVNWQSRGKGWAYQELDKDKDYIIATRKDGRGTIAYFGSRVKNAGAGVLVGMATTMPFKSSKGTDVQTNEVGQTYVKLHVPVAGTDGPAYVCRFDGVYITEVDGQKRDDEAEPLVLTPGTHTFRIRYFDGYSYSLGIAEVMFAALPNQIYRIQADKTGMSLRYQVRNWTAEVYPKQQWRHVD